MNKRVKTGVIWAFVALMLVFMYLPIIILIVFSFTDARALGVWSGFSLELYADLFNNAQVMVALGNSLILAFVSAVLATVLGTAAAIGIFHMRKWKKHTADFVANITMENAEIVTGVAFMIFFLAVRSRRGCRS